MNNPVPIGIFLSLFQKALQPTSTCNMDNVLSFVNTACETISIVLTFGTILFGVFAWAKGILPALWRLGNGLSNRRIAIFHEYGQPNSLKQLLTDSKLYNESNICLVGDITDIGRCEGASLFLVYYPDWKEHLESIIGRMKDTSAIIVYAPAHKERIEQLHMELIGRCRNAVVTQFRGRLLNDVLTSMMTTAYEQ